MTKILVTGHMLARMDTREVSLGEVAEVMAKGVRIQDPNNQSMERVTFGDLRVAVSKRDGAAHSVMSAKGFTGEDVIVRTVSSSPTDEQMKQVDELVDRFKIDRRQDGPRTDTRRFRVSV